MVRVHVYESTYYCQLQRGSHTPNFFLNCLCSIKITQKMDTESQKSSCHTVTSPPQHPTPPSSCSHQLIHTQSQIMIIQGTFSDTNIPQGIYCIPSVRGYNGTSLYCAVHTVLYFVQAVFKKTSTERELCVCGARDGTPRHGR